MGKLLKLFQHYSLLILQYLQPFGPWGILAVAIIDNALIVMPLDLMVATYVWTSQGRVLFYAAIAALGSAVGSLVPFGIGRAGGELFLLKRIDRARFERMRDRFESQEFLAVMIPAILPPPTPFKLFVFSAGVFEMRTALFMLATFLGRLIRYAILGELVLRYGPQVVNMAASVMKQHLWLVLAGFVLLVAGGWFAYQHTSRRRALRQAGETPAP